MYRSVGEKPIGEIEMVDSNIECPLMSAVLKAVKQSPVPLSISEIEKRIRPEDLPDDVCLDSITVQRSVRRLIESGQLAAGPSYRVKSPL